MTEGAGGLLVDHRYRLERRIGAGGSASIYEATDTNLDKQVAVKILSPQHWDDPVQIARFQREARAIARIRHEHLVDVTHHGMTDDGMPFLVMEHLPGWDLQAELSRLGGAMPWPRAVRIVVQVLAALAAAHEAGVVHRDVKPSNCFLVQRRGGGDYVKVLDLGIAKVVDDDAPPLTRVSVGVPGTVHYMAPEQVRGQAVDPRADLYAVGVMLYRMLAGALPFVAPGDSPYEVMRLHCEAAPPRLRDAVPGAGVPDELDEAIQRALAKRPEDRWPDAETFAAALEAIQSQVTIAPILRTDRVAPVQRGLRRPMIAVIAAAVAVVAVTVALVAGDVGRAEAGVADASASLAAAPSAVTPADGIAARKDPAGPAEAALADAGTTDEAHDHDEDHAHDPPHVDALADADTVAASSATTTRTGKKRRRDKKIDPAVPELLQELAVHRPSFSRCRAQLPAGTTLTLRFALTLERGSGEVLAVTPQREPTTKAAACALEVLRGMHFHAGAQGGTFKGLELTL